MVQKMKRRVLTDVFIKSSFQTFDKLEMVQKMKRRVLTDVFIKSWFQTSDKLKIVCKKQFKFPEDDGPDFIKGYAYTMKRNDEKDESDELCVINSNKYIHYVYKFGTKNKFFHKHFEIARIK